MNFSAISYKIPANPSRHRVAVWKALRELGAVYLQDGVAVLPQSVQTEAALRELREQILGCGGQAALLQIAFPDPADEQSLLQAFADARSEEYAALQHDAQRLKAQLDWERSRTDGADKERCGLELRRLKRRLSAAVGRDPWHAAGREEAERAVQELLDELPGALDASGRRGRPAGKASAGPMPAAKKAGSTPETVPAAAPNAAEQPRPEPAESGKRPDMPVFLF